MLIFLKVNNYLIFNKETEFSMRANMHYKLFPTNLYRANYISVLKTAIVFGPNNSGKTKFVDAISTIRDIMLNRGNSIAKNLFVNNSISEFEIGFLSQENEYVFSIKYDVNSKEFLYESLSKNTYDKHGNCKNEIIYERDSINKHYLCEYNNSEFLAAMRVSSKNNILIYLLDTNQFKTLEESKKIITTFASKIDIVDMNNIPIEKTISMLKSNKSMQKKISNFIVNADLSMDEFRYLNDDEFNATVKISSLDENPMPQETVLKFNPSIIDLFHLISVYKGVPVPSILYDSTGTKKMAAIASYVIDALENERVLIVDEIDNSLHFLLSRAIIALFNNSLNSKAQLVCTSHDVSLLDCQRLFRKEQIWFAHKNKENAYLYSLSEFTSEKDKVRDTSNIMEKYKKGVFGALPEPNLLNTLLEIRANE